jgi:hypothetical protein
VADYSLPSVASVSGSGARCGYRSWWRSSSRSLRVWEGLQRLDCLDEDEIPHLLTQEFSALPWNSQYRSLEQTAKCCGWDPISDLDSQHISTFRGLPPTATTPTRPGHSISGSARSSVAVDAGLTRPDTSPCLARHR